MKTIQNDMTENIINEPPKIESPPRFENPYPKETHERVQLWIGADDVMFIRLLRPQVGTLSAVGGHLWSKLCAALRQIGIKDFTQCNEFEQFTSNSVLISTEEYDILKSDSANWQQYRAQLGGIIHEPGRPIDRSNPDSNEGNGGKRAKRVRAVSSDESKKRTDVPGKHKE